MKNRNKAHSIDRRTVLGTGALTVLGIAATARAQEPSPKGKAKMSEANSIRVGQAIAEFISEFDLAKVPQPVIARMRESFVDTVGVMLAGSHEDVFRLVCEMIKEESASATTSIVQERMRTSPQLAALANGVAAHGMDYDLTFIGGQSICAVIPAVLALAETTKATPAEIASAFIVGAEVGGRCVRANFNASDQGGWHTTGIVGTIAAAAAAAYLMKVPKERIPHVIGIAASLAAGITANFGTMSKPLHAGNAARNGILAARLGGRGFTAHPQAMERRSGYFAAFGRGLKVTLEPFKDFGSRYDLAASRYSIKAYPCGGLTHTSIEAALELRNSVGSRIGEIKDIHCYVTANAGQRAGTQYPSTIESAKFSVAYLVSYSLIHGAPRIAAFTDKALDDDRLKALAKVIAASVDPDLGPGTAGSPARIRITMNDGKVFEARVEDATGSVRNPMTKAQLEDKFTDCAAVVMDNDKAAKILAILNALPDRNSLDDFWPLFRKG